MEKRKIYFIENSGNYVTNSPEFSNRQFLKTNSITNKIVHSIGIILILAMVLSFSFAEAQSTTICCEQTNSNLYCQDVPASECKTNMRQVPTACSSTSYCKDGVCYDSNEGTCTDNTPQLVCNNNGGVWSETMPKQCNLGCCVLGDQAAFVPLVRCKRLSSMLGLQTNYRSDITNEVSCVLSVQNQEKGACVYELDFEKTCRFTTRAACLGGESSEGMKGEFYAGKLCSAAELGTNCGPSRQTTCLPGKEEVYFVDTCGNPANIYDSSKIKDAEYWTNIKTKTESCNANSANAVSPSCGNCNYLLGSFCRTAERGKKPTYGDSICADLNCEKTQNGKSYKHGESWCVYNDKGNQEGEMAVGSRFFKHICINGVETLEQCADFRNEVCLQDKIVSGGVEFSQAACRVNRWQDCAAQDNQLDCENTDKRDCRWASLSGVFGLAFGNAEEGGVCVPKVKPGLEFWNDNSKTTCAQAKSTCVVEYEEGFFTKKKCVKNCECIEEGTWREEHEGICSAIADCGESINFIGKEGISGIKLNKIGK